MDPDGRSPFSFFLQEPENYTEFDTKYKTRKRTSIISTFTIYSNNKETLQDFKDTFNFNEGMIYEYNENDCPKVLSEYSEEMENDNIVIVTAKKEINIKYDNVYNEYKSSEEERVILMFEKTEDGYVQKNEN